MTIFSQCLIFVAKMLIQFVNVEMCSLKCLMEKVDYLLILHYSFKEHLQTNHKKIWKQT